MKRIASVSEKIRKPPLAEAQTAAEKQIIIIQHLYSAIMSYADTEALVAPVKSE